MPVGRLGARSRIRFARDGSHGATPGLRASHVLYETPWPARYALNSAFVRCRPFHPR